MTTEATVKKHQAYIDQKRQELLKTFAPAFYFHSGESSFPMNPDDYVKDVIMAKYECYGKLSRPLEAIEKEEFEVIKDYFIIDGKFNENYNVHMDKPALKALLARRAEPHEDEHLLTFDEKKYGYRLGEKVPIKGIHPNNKEGKKAPITVSIMPTEEGARIKYEYFYAVSDAIPGTKWLYNLLPYKWAKKAKDFAVHAGDFEGVEIDVKIDANGKASINGMQTFAHGRDGARFVEPKDLTYDKDGRPSVFVGQQTHPSYADNFVGRSKFVDKVGNKYKLVPDTFIDLSPDKEQKKELPKWSPFVRIGNTSSLIHESPKDHKQLAEKSKGWNNYKPTLALTKAWNKIKGVVSGKKKAEPMTMKLPPVEFTRKEANDPSVGKSRTQEVTQAKAPEFLTELTRKQRSASWGKAAEVEKLEKASRHKSVGIAN